MVGQVSPAPAGLRRNAIGLREVLFQSITDMAPGAAIAASIPSGAAFAGGSLPLSVIFALIACLFCAVSIAELAKRIPSAGSLATYAAQGLHNGVGFLVAWGYVLVGMLIGPLVLLQLGFTVAGTFHSEWASYPANLWWPWTILGTLIVMPPPDCTASATSAGLGTVLGIFEIAVFVDHGVPADRPRRQCEHVVRFRHRPHAVDVSRHHRRDRRVGLHRSSPSAGSRAPRRWPRRPATHAVRSAAPCCGAALSIGILYIFTTYAIDVAFGPDKFATFGSSGATRGRAWPGRLYGLFWMLVFLAIVNSTIANANAGVNVSRAGPRLRWAGSVHSRTRWRGSPPGTARRMWRSCWSPRRPSAVSLGLGFGYDPTTAFVMVGHRHRDPPGGDLHHRDISVHRRTSCATAGREFNVLLHLMVPILGVVAFMPAWLTAAGIPAFLFIAAADRRRCRTRARPSASGWCSACSTWS